MYIIIVILLGIRQTGKAVDSESIIYWFETSMPNLVKVPFYRSLFCLHCFKSDVIVGIMFVNIEGNRKWQVILIQFTMY